MELGDRRREKGDRRREIRGLRIPKRNMKL
jgi:hypothetical protein